MSGGVIWGVLISGGRPDVRWGDMGCPDVMLMSGGVIWGVLISGGCPDVRWGDMGCPD